MRAHNSPFPPALRTPIFGVTSCPLIGKDTGRDEEMDLGSLKHTAFGRLDHKSWAARTVTMNQNGRREGLLTTGG